MPNDPQKKPIPPRYDDDPFIGSRFYKDGKKIWPPIDRTPHFPVVDDGEEIVDTDIDDKEEMGGD